MRESDRQAIAYDTIDKHNDTENLLRRCRTTTRVVDTRCLLTVLSVIALFQNPLPSVRGFQQPAPLQTNRRFDRGTSKRHRTARLLALGNDSNGCGSFCQDWAGDNSILTRGSCSTTAVPSHRRRLTPIGTRRPSNRSSPSPIELSLSKDSSTEAAIAYDPVETEIYSRAVKKTILCVGAAVAFGLGILYKFGYDQSAEFFAGYLVEQSLSIDNLFVFLLLFDYFKVPLSSQDRVLSYGIYGAVVMRAVMIGLGSVALQRYHGILLVFAGILVYSSAKVLIEATSGDDEDEEENMGDNMIVKFSKSLFSATEKFDGKKFFTMEDGINKATPLFLCLVAVEISDVVFAIDSIPAVFGVTENALIVFTSNMFAILGLRSLYTVLSKAAKDLEFLEPAVAVVLGFIGSKMVAEYFGTIISTEISLGVVAACLSSGVGLSIWKKNLDGETAVVVDATVVDSSSDINS